MSEAHQSCLTRLLLIGFPSSYDSSQQQENFVTSHLGASQVTIPALIFILEISETSRLPRVFQNRRNCNWMILIDLWPFCGVWSIFQPVLIKLILEKYFSTIYHTCLAIITHQTIFQIKYFPHITWFLLSVFTPQIQSQECKKCDNWLYKPDW